VTDFLADTRNEIDSRLKKLKPQVDEYNRLEAAAAALADIPGPSNALWSGLLVIADDAEIGGASASPRRRGPGRPPGSKSTRAPAAKPAKAKATKATAARKAAGRRRGSGKRGAEALALVKGAPGITIPELAAKMGIKQNYLYRVLPALGREGLVDKQGRGWHPTAKAAR
jgi:hypothetical protein